MNMYGADVNTGVKCLLCSITIPSTAEIEEVNDSNHEQKNRQSEDSQK